MSEETKPNATATDPAAGTPPAAGATPPTQPPAAPTAPPSTPAAAATPPAAPPAAPPTAPSKQEEPAKPKGREADLEKSVADLQFQNKVIREAAKLGAKDPDYLEYLAGKARGEQGDKFDLTKWAGDLKTARPDLFGGTAAPATPATPAQPASTTTATTAATSAERASIEQQIEEAKKKGDALAVLNLKSKLANTK